MRVSLHETASQRLQIYMNDIFTLLMLPFVWVFFKLFFFFFADKKKLSAMTKPVVMKVALNTKKSNKINQGLSRPFPTPYLVW